MENELSRLVETNGLPDAGKTLHVTTTPDERHAVASRLGINSVINLSAELSIRPSLGQQTILEGTVDAEIEQACVVTGEPVVTQLSFDLRRVFSPDADPFAGLSDDDEEVSGEGEDVDPIGEEGVDAGEAIVEELALQIPPYPRLENAVFDGYASAPAADEEQSNPFAVLKSLKTDLESKD